jgi:hypothetical protein
MTIDLSLLELSQLVDCIEDAYVPEGEDSLALEGHPIRPLYLRLRELWERMTPSSKAMSEPVSDYRLATYVVVSQAMYRTFLEQVGSAFEEMYRGESWVTTYPNKMYQTAMEQLGNSGLYK